MTTRPKSILGALVWLAPLAVACSEADAPLSADHDAGSPNGADAGTADAASSPGNEPNTDPGVFAKSYATGLNVSSRAIIQTDDLGYLFVGHGDVDPSSDFDSNLFVVKLSATGTVAWARGLNASLNDEGYDVKATSDGYVVAGATGPAPSRPWVIKLGLRGELQWEQTYPPHDSRDGYRIATVPGDDDAEDGFVVVGASELDRPKGLVIRLGNLGEVIWERRFSAGGDARANAVLPTTDGGFVVVGERFVRPTRSAVWLVKLDAMGGVVWHRTLSAIDTGDGFAAATGVHETSDGYVVAAYADFDETLATATDAWVIKLDLAGVVLWQKRYGLARFNESVAASALDRRGHLHLAGATQGELMWLEVDELGALLNQRTFGGLDNDRAWAISATDDDGVAILGEVGFVPARRDAWVVKLDPSAAIEFGSGSNVSSAPLALVTANHLRAVQTATDTPVLTSSTTKAALPELIEPQWSVTTQSR